jgi:CheY-like chemotaxis protein
MPEHHDNESSPADSTPATILCIDDQADSLEIRKTYLELFGLKVLTATSGREGLALLQSTPVDLLILDYKMPEMDGSGVAAIVREHHPEMPILLLSGYPTEIPSEFLASVDGYLFKGQNPQLLINEINRLLFSEEDGQFKPLRKRTLPMGEHIQRVESIIQENKKRLHRLRENKLRENKKTG